MGKFSIGFRVREAVRLIEMGNKREREQKFVEGIGILLLDPAKNHLAVLIL